MAEKVSRDRGYRSDGSAVSRDMGPLWPDNCNCNPPNNSKSFFHACNHFEKDDRQNRNRVASKLPAQK